MQMLTRLRVTANASDMPSYKECDTVFQFLAARWRGAKLLLYISTTQFGL
jgi:hypothetical protein